MPPGALIRNLVIALDKIAGQLGRDPAHAAHLAVGTRGEEAAYFHLRALGYVMVARNYRSALHRGEIDIIGWDGETLCFIEVKTRTSHAGMPAEDAVDAAKRHDLRAVARDYLRHLHNRPTSRFDIVTVYLETSEEPAITLFKNAFEVA